MTLTLVIINGLVRTGVIGLDRQQKTKHMVNKVNQNSSKNISIKSARERFASQQKGKLL